MKTFGDISVFIHHGIKLYLYDLPVIRTHCKFTGDVLDHNTDICFLGLQCCKKAPNSSCKKACRTVLSSQINPRELMRELVRVCGEVDLTVRRSHRSIR